MTTDPPIRAFLSPPDERELRLGAFDSNWIAQSGLHVEVFGAEVAVYVGAEHEVAMSSGTAALHLALLEAVLQSGGAELCSTLTFVATANANRYVGAEPASVDATREDWNLNAELVAEDPRSPRATVAASARW